MTRPDVSAAAAALSPPETYQVLYDLAYLVPGDQAVVELGTYYGASALALAQGARDGAGARVYTIDPHDLPGYRTTTGAGPRPRRPLDYTDPAIRIRAAEAIQAAGLDGGVTMIRGFSDLVGHGWGGGPVGLLYVDGDHREGSVRRDFAAWEPHLAPGALVCFDDHRDAFPGVMTVVSHLVDKQLLEEPVMVGSLAVTRRRKR